MLRSERNNMKRMTENKWYVEIYSWMMRIFIVLTFFFPMYHSDFKKHMYYIGFLWPYVFLLLGMGMLFLRHCRQRWENKGFALFLIVLLTAYIAVSLYMNRLYHHWMWEEIHNTVAFAFLILLLIYPKWMQDLDFDVIRFLLQCVTLSMFCAIVYYAIGYAGLLLHNGMIEMTTVAEMVSKYGETRMSWIYYHKSQFALMQLVFLGFAHTYRAHFKTRVHYGITQLIFVICLVLSHSWTALAAAFLIPGGIFLDKLLGAIRQKRLHFRRWHFVIAGVGALGVIGCAALFLVKMSQERNLLTLGSRIPIWQAGIRLILENPQGVGKEFGKNLIDCGLFLTNNCHNVFLNAMMRYSIPVGLLFTVIMLSFLIRMLLRQKTFFGVGYIAALLMVLCIDYSLLSYGVASFLLLVSLTMNPQETDDEPVQETNDEPAQGNAKTASA